MRLQKLALKIRRVRAWNIACESRQIDLTVGMQNSILPKHWHIPFFH